MKRIIFSIDYVYKVKSVEVYLIFHFSTAFFYILGSIHNVHQYLINLIPPTRNRKHDCSHSPRNKRHAVKGGEGGGQEKNSTKKKFDN